MYMNEISVNSDLNGELGSSGEPLIELRLTRDQFYGVLAGMSILHPNELFSFYRRLDVGSWKVGST